MPPHTTAIGLLLALAATPHADAQRFRYLPANAPTTEGNELINNVWSSPFGNSRFQQIQNSLGPRPLQLRGLAVRRDQLVAGRQRSVTLELRIGDGDIDRFDKTFSSNYLRPPTTVIGRGAWQLPNTERAGPVPAAPFTIVFPFQTTYAYSGQDDLVYEFLNHAVPTSGGTYGIDLHELYGSFGSTRNFDTCQNWFLHSAAAHAQAHNQTLTFRSSVFLTRGTAPLLGLGIGLQRTRIPIGSCFLRVVPTAVFLGRTTSFGRNYSRYDLPAIQVPWQPSLQGLRIQTQGFHPTLPAVTNAAETVIPAMASSPVMVRSLFGRFNASVGSLLRTVGGMVTRFEHR